MSLLEVRGVTKAFGDVTVLRGVDLDVPPGSLAAVLGPSGCGKTTLLRVLAGFERAGSGTITLGDRGLAGPGVHVAPDKRHIAVVPQEGALFPHLSVADNVAFGLDRGTDRRHRVGALLELVGLEGYQRRMPSELSGGQQQRVALARALAPDPHVVLLDEPFSALDAGLRASVRADVRAALHATGATAVLVTHDQEEALSTADVVAVMRDGVVVQAGTPEEVYRTPHDLDVARFVGEAVVIPGTVRNGVMWTALGSLPIARAAAADGVGTAVLRPEQVILVERGQGLPARVLDTVFFGHDANVMLEVSCPGDVTLPVMCRTQGDLPEGEHVGVRIAGPVSWFPRAS